MNILKIIVVAEDEMFNGSKSKYLLAVGGIFIFLSLVIIHYSNSIISLFPFQNNINVPYYLISYLVVLILGPLVTLIASYDFICNEIQTGSIRYIISKIDRTSFILGKFLALSSVFTVAVFIIAIISSLYSLFLFNNAFELGKIILFVVISSLYLSCFISGFLFISTLSPESKTALIMSGVFLGILIFAFFKGNGNFLKYLTPYFYGISNIELFGGLTHNFEFFELLKTIFLMIVYNSVFLSLASIAIKRRDL